MEEAGAEGRDVPCRTLGKGSPQVGQRPYDSDRADHQEVARGVVMSLPGSGVVGDSPPYWLVGCVPARGHR